MYINLPRAAVYAMKTLTGAGHQAYIVGGSVRDVLLGKQPDDFDITTDALPEEMCELFKKDRLSLNGLKHGTVRLIKYATAIEITTFRLDGNYEDGRHPDEVVFTGSLYEDVQRRDFTINAMCWNEKAGLIDYTGGQEDLRDRVIRSVGIPTVRFEEDALRIMRAIRFSSVLDFDIEPETARAVHSCRELLHQIAVERIWMEMKKLLCGPRAERVMTEFRDVMLVLIPQLQRLTPDQYILACRRCALTAPAPILRLSALGYDLGHDAAMEMGAHLKISKADAKLLDGLMACRDEPLPNTRSGMRRAISRRGEELMAGLTVLNSANAQALCQLIIQQGDCVSLKQLALDGEDVHKLGVTRRATGACLEGLLGLVMDDQAENTRESLSAVVRAQLSEKAAAEPAAPKKKSRRRASNAKKDAPEAAAPAEPALAEQAPAEPDEM